MNKYLNSYKPATHSKTKPAIGNKTGGEMSFVFRSGGGVCDYKRYPVPFSRDQLRNIFLKHDGNGDGRLSRIELKSAFDSLGSNWSSFRARQCLKAADSDSDGFITLDELDRLLDYTVSCEYAIL